MGAKYFGAAVRRREDPRFLRGEGRFLDDVRVAGLLHVAFLRSPYAHAMIRAIRTERARAAPGVVAVFTFADLESWMKPLPLFGAPPPSRSARPRSSRSAAIAPATSGRSSRWWWPRVARAPRTPPRRSRSSGSPGPW